MPAEPDAAAEALQALRRGLTRADAFALFVVVCNVPAERERYLRVLDETLPGLRIQRARLTAETLDPLAETLAQTTPGPGAAIALLDVERAVPSSEPYHPMLENFNLQRQRWVEHVPCPVMMWVPEYVVPYLNREAPDFMDRRSGLLVLPQSAQATSDPFNPWDSPQSLLSIEQRLARIRELAARLHLHESSDDPPTLAACVAWLGELGAHYHWLAEWRPAEDAYRRQADLAARLSDERALARAQVNLGDILTYQTGRHAEARALFETAIHTFRRLGLHSELAATLRRSSLLELASGRVADARLVLDEAAEIIEDHGGDPDEVVALLANSAVIALSDPASIPRAETLLDRAFDLVQRYAADASPALLARANLRERQGRLTEALAAAQSALAVEEGYGRADRIAQLRLYLGRLHLNSGDLVGARSLLSGALHEFERSGDLPRMARAAGMLSIAAARMGDAAACEEYLESAKRSASQAMDPEVATWVGTLVDAANLTSAPRTKP